MNNYPPGVSQQTIDEANGHYESVDEKIDREAKLGDMKRDKEVDEQN